MLKINVKGGFFYYLLLSRFGRLLQHVAALLKTVCSLQQKYYPWRKPTKKKTDNIGAEVDIPTQNTNSESIFAERRHGTPQVFGRHSPLTLTRERFITFAPNPTFNFLSVSCGLRVSP